MEIDEIIQELESTKDYPASDPASDEALDGAIEIMRKYQKIKQIMSNNGYWCNELQLRDIRKVVEDGNEH